MRNGAREPHIPEHPLQPNNQLMYRRYTICFHCIVKRIVGITLSFRPEIRNLEARPVWKTIDGAYFGGCRMPLVQLDTPRAKRPSRNAFVRKNNLVRSTVTIGALLLGTHSVLSISGTAPVGTADELVAHHLDALGNAQARAGAKTRVAQGTTEFKLLVGGAGTLDGKSQFVSDGTKLHFIMKFANNEYRGEQFIFNGSKVEVSSSTAQQGRSALGGFVYVQDAVVREGLWGGVLSTAWPLLNLEKRKAKVTYDGLKKIDGQDLYELRYQPKKGTDLEIRLYFDPETYRHVLTVYTLSEQRSLGNVSQPGASNETASARQQQTRYRLEERFSDFKNVDGLILPTHYDIHFTQELQSGRTTVYEWKIQETDLANNTPLDERNFAVK